MAEKKKQSYGSLAREYPNAVLIVVMGLIVVSFCFYKVATAGHSHANGDRPAAAFSPSAPPRITLNQYLSAPRLPDDSYQALSRFSAEIGNAVRRRHLGVRMLVRAGASRAAARRIVHAMLPFEQQLRSSKLSINSAYHLLSLNGGDAVVAANILLVDPSGRTPPIAGRLIVEYVSGDDWATASLKDVRFDLGS